MHPVSAVGGLRFVVAPVEEDVVGNATINSRRDGVGYFRVDVYVSDEVLGSVLKLVHPDDRRGE